MLNSASTFVRTFKPRPGFASVGRLSNFATWMSKLCSMAGVEVSRFDIKAFDAFVDSQRDAGNTYFDGNGKPVPKGDPTAVIQYFKTNLFQGGDPSKEILAKFVFNPSIKPPLPPWDGVEFVIQENRPTVPTPFLKPIGEASAGLQRQMFVSKERLVESVSSCIDGRGWVSLASVGTELEHMFPGFTYEGTGFAKLSDLIAASGLFEMSRDENGLPVIRKNGILPAVVSHCPKLMVQTKWSHKDELDFLRDFSDFLGNAGFKYDGRDIVRFHTAVKTEKMTVLGGIPGTGKSSLAELYIRMLMGPDYLTWNNNLKTGNYLTIDVSPSWTEPSDLIGYYNLKHEFQPAENGFYSFLRSAMAGDDLRFVCLEEMNLAVVEHYFASFMQVLSKRDSESCVLHGCRCADEESDLMVSPTVRFIGTCNSDETTQSLSPRFLDRCNYIELNPVASFEDYVRLYEKRARNMFDVNLPSKITYEAYSSWVDPMNHVLESVCTRLESIWKGFSSVGVYSSPRVLGGMIRYISNRPPILTDEFDSVEALQLHALDEALVQRVLSGYRPKPFGGETQRDKLLELVGDFDLCSGYIRDKYDAHEHPMPT